MDPVVPITMDTDLVARSIDAAYQVRMLVCHVAQGKERRPYLVFVQQPQ